LKNLLALGIQARKDNKARLARLQEIHARNGIPSIEDVTHIREPDKYPTLAEKLLTTDEGWEGLVQMIRELEQLVPLEEQDNEVEISTQAGIMEEEEEEVPEYKDSSPVDSDVESMADSIDSIQNNADFVLLE
jgi:hypothetical protein